MAAIMVVYMDITDSSWTQTYFAAVPAIMGEYGGVSIAGGREISRLEGDMKIPERIAVISFPSRDAIKRFMNDPRYLPFRAAREAGARSEIFVFENAVADGKLV